MLYYANKNGTAIDEAAYQGLYIVNVHGIVKSIGKPHTYTHIVRAVSEADAQASVARYYEFCEAHVEVEYISVLPADVIDTTWCSAMTETEAKRRWEAKHPGESFEHHMDVLAGI